jgi:hypothetical protein
MTAAASRGQSTGRTVSASCMKSPGGARLGHAPKRPAGTSVEALAIARGLLLQRASSPRPHTQLRGSGTT